MARLITLTLLLVVCTWSAYPMGVIKLDSGIDAKTPTWKELIDSFLEGSTIDELIANSTECFHDVEDSYEDMNEAIGHFIKRGWSWENYLDLNGALGSFTPLIRTCYDVSIGGFEDASDYFGSFDSFADFATQAKNNIIAHVFDWYDVIAKMNEALTKKDSRAIAFQSGRAISLFFIFTPKLSEGNSLSTGVTELPDFRWLEDFMRGFVNGTQVLSSQRVKNCINETEFMVKSIEDANAQFAKKSDEGYREGIFEVADMFEHLKPVNEQCYYAIGDIESTVQKYIKTFKSPIDIAFNAARHFNELYIETLSCIQNFRNEEYYASGYDIGEMFYYIFCDK